MNSATENSTAPTSELYDRHYYRHDCGPTPYDRSPAWHDLFSSFSDHIIGRISPRTVLDAGCAIGLLVEELRETTVWPVEVAMVPERHRGLRHRPLPLPTAWQLRGGDGDPAEGS